MYRRENPIASVEVGNVAGRERVLDRQSRRLGFFERGKGILGLPIHLEAERAFFGSPLLPELLRHSFFRIGLLGDGLALWSNRHGGISSMVSPVLYVATAEPNCERRRVGKACPPAGGRK